MHEVIQDIQSGVADPIHPKMYDAYYTNLNKAIRGVFKPDSTNGKHLDYYYKMNANAAKFAAYKSHTVTNELRRVLDADPKNFQDNAKKVIKKYNRYQAVEYNTTMSRCRTARQWGDFQGTKDVLPNLEWIHTRSYKARELHLSFVGLVLPIDSEFWKTNQPGNLYNCKCDWRRVDKPVSQTPPNVKPSPGLDGNPGIDGDIFSDNHPYIKNCDKKTVKEIDRYCYKNYLKPITDDYREKLPITGLVVKSDNLITGQMTIIKNSIRQITKKNNVFKVQCEALFLKSSCQDWKYIGYAESLGKHHEALYFLYYEAMIGQEKKYVNVIIHRGFNNAEVPYTILNTIDMSTVKMGIPVNLNIKK